MSRTYRIQATALALALMLAISTGAFGCSPEPAEETPAVTPQTNQAEPETDTGTEADPAKDLVDTKCSLCHTVERVYSAQKSRDEWVVTMDRMRSNGLVVTDEEYDAIVEFLAGE